jgi:hypothetical protein
MWDAGHDGEIYGFSSVQWRLGANKCWYVPLVNTISRLSVSDTIISKSSHTCAITFWLWSGGLCTQSDYLGIRVPRLKMALTPRESIIHTFRTWWNNSPIPVLYHQVRLQCSSSNVYARASFISCTALCLLCTFNQEKHEQRTLLGDDAA